MRYRYRLFDGALVRGFVHLSNGRIETSSRCTDYAATCFTQSVRSRCCPPSHWGDGEHTQAFAKVTIVAGRPAPSFHSIPMNSSFQDQSLARPRSSLSKATALDFTHRFKFGKSSLTLIGVPRSRRRSGQQAWSAITCRREQLHLGVLPAFL